MQGQVAYVRCDGAEQADARFPCPRDRTFEAAVWRVLQELPECTGNGPGRGLGEARLSWARSGPVEVRFRGEDGASLDLGAVSKCAGDRLAALRPGVLGERMIAAFHFELR